MNKWLYVFVEIKVREFDSRLLLSCFAAEAGFNIIFGHQVSIIRNLKHFPKGVIFDKSISKNKFNRFKLWIKDGFKIVSIDEEGLTSHDNKFNYLNQRISGKTLNLASLIFTWGKDEAELILDNYPQFKNKIKIVGNPRIDLWRTDLKNIYWKQAQRYKKKYRRYILLPSNFGSNHVKGISFVLKQAWQFGTISNKKEEREFISILEYNKKSFRAHIELIKNLAKHFNKINFIVRPHPVEDSNAWQELKVFPNIKVIYKGIITPWILGSELMIHNSCTTGLESYLLGKPVISYLPYKDSKFGKHISNGVSLRFNKREKIIHACEQILNDSSYFKKNLKLWPSLYDIIASIDGKISSQKIIEYLSEIDWPDSSVKKAKIAFIKNLLFTTRRNTRMLCWKSNILKNKYSYGFQKFPGSSLKEVKNLINQYKKITGKFKRIKVSKIGNDLYYIREE